MLAHCWPAPAPVRAAWRLSPRPTSGPSGHARHSPFVFDLSRSVFDGANQGCPAGSSAPRTSPFTNGRAGGKSVLLCRLLSWYWPTCPRSFVNSIGMTTCWKGLRPGP
jgi:hypothetical protein